MLSKATSYFLEEWYELMCDVKKYSEIYNEIKSLQPEDTLQLIMEADDKEEKDFFGVVGNFLLQQKQKKAIEENWL